MRGAEKHALMLAAVNDALFTGWLDVLARK
ncbi:hypothetical protein Q644_13380 [Brucella intermedia 229E]|uniref:Uncharacterized protein n=1 Tax=Brucella intermedia 229E TaxID=1337887 RepID=U4VJK6_9HYPH|nr:hypothetical protein Q644_13380 [Brucella intermedia 229E]